MDVGIRTDEQPTQRHHEAMSRGQFQEALDQLQELADERDLSVAELELLANAAYGAGDLETSISAWEHLHARQIATGEHLMAARAATSVAMYLMMDTGLMAPVRGWLARAERLLEGQDEAAVHAWLAMTRTYERLLSGDLERAGHWAGRASHVGDRQAAPAPATLGRIAQARLRIFDGHVDEGLALLDDAAVTIMSGSIDPLVTGMAYCELICAMQGLAQYDRAEQWTNAMERWRHDNAFGGINGRCRVHRAEILRLRGSCQAAEDEALHACAELRPWMRREFGWPLTELGVIRLRRGDLAGAEEAFLEAHHHGWDPQPGLALLRLAQGDAAQAAALIGDALDRPVNAPSKERPPHTDLQRAPLLEAQVEICLAVGDITTARAAADAVTRTAEVFRSRALSASSVLAQARISLVDQDTEAAIRGAATAVAIWCEIGAPYETAVARAVLAEALDQSGNEVAARAERTAAHEALEQIGARLPGSEATGPIPDVQHHTGAVEPVASATTAQQTFKLEGDTRTIVFDDTSVLLRDLKGMHYLERLLNHPCREFHVLDLVFAEQGTGPKPVPIDAAVLPAASEGSAGPILDATAKQAYQRRLAEIEDDIEEATRLGDVDRAALAAADRDYLVAELSRAVGLGGRARTTGSTSERARASVTRTLRYAMSRIASHHTSLGQHLEQTIRTGTYCSYQPDPRTAGTWHT